MGPREPLIASTVVFRARNYLEIFYSVNTFYSLFLLCFPFVFCTMSLENASLLHLFSRA